MTFQKNYTVLFIFIEDIPSYCIWASVLVTLVGLSFIVGNFADTLSKVVPATKLSLAFSLNSFIMTTGGSFLPLLVGLVTDLKMHQVDVELSKNESGSFGHGNDADYEYQWQRYHALKTGLLMMPCLAVFGGASFRVAAKYFVDDKIRNEANAESTSESKSHLGM